MKSLIVPLAALLIGITAGTAWTVTTWDPPADLVAGDSLDAHAGPDAPADVPEDPAPDSADQGDDGSEPAEMDVPDDPARDGAGAIAAPTTEPGPAGPQPAPADTGGEIPTPGAANPAPAPPADGFRNDAPDADAALEAMATGPRDDPATVALQVRSVAGAKQLARIFAAMQPRDAAAVLDHMSDAEITSILGHIQPRQAASILSSMDADRAALLSRSVLGGGAP